MPDQRTTLEPEHIMSGDAEESSNSSSDPTITTIPDKFYGAALHAQFAEKKKEPRATQADTRKMQGETTQRRQALPIIIGIVVLLLAAGGVFAFLNKDVLFPSAATPIVPAATSTIPTEPPKPPEAEPVPSAPTNLSATATSPTSVQLSWQDTSNNEAGFRIERRDPSSDYRSITSLPPNSTAYQDSSVVPQTSYLYRIIAVNSGGDSPASNETSVLTPAVPPPAPEQPKLPPAGLDSDSDGLTDLEENLYGTDPHNPDTDRDSFLDGNEVFHLYNPAGAGNGSLIDSGKVTKYTSPAGWTMLVPTAWNISSNADGTLTTISTGHGESFLLSIQRNDSHQLLLDWYLANHPGVLSSQVGSIQTKSGLKGLEGVDLLTTYFTWDGGILSFEYKLNDQTFINFRTTYEMMKNSLHFLRDPSLPAEVASPAPVQPTGGTPVLPAPTPIEPTSASTTAPVIPPLPMPEPGSTSS
ncbi:MAG: fibronectin type III domain-containing protein [Patescibacteria group bacterium]